MRKLLVVLLAAALCFGLSGVAMAGIGGTDSATITITVAETVDLEVPAAAAFDIATVGPGLDYSMPGDDTTASGFKFSHNHAVDVKVTAVAVKDGGNAANDVTLTVKVGTEAVKVVVSAGADVALGEVVCTKAAGAYNEDITYGVTNVTIAETPVGSYVWTVTFTAEDVA